jgi:hypothetical protein
VLRTGDRRAIAKHREEALGVDPQRRGFLLAAGAGALGLAAGASALPGPAQAVDSTSSTTVTDTSAIVVRAPTGVSATDMASIQAAIAKAPPGGRVVLTPGVYAVDSLHLPDHTFLDLNGATIRQVNPTNGSAGGAAVRNSDQVGGNKDITVVNGTISLGANAKGRVLAFVHVANVTLSNVTLDKGTGIFADWMLYLRNCDDVRITSCRVIGGTQLGEDGLHLKACSRVVVDNCVISAGDDAIAVVQEFDCDRSNHDITISNCAVSSAKAHLLRVSVYPTERFGVQRLVVSNIVGSAPVGATGTPIQINSSKLGLIRDVVLENIELDCSHAPGTGLRMTNVIDSVVRGVHLRDVSSSVFLIEGSSRVTFSECHGNQRSGTRNDAWCIVDSTDVQLTNCSAISATNTSFAVKGAGSARVTFTACRSTAPTAHGWALRAAAGVSLIGCTATGGVAAVVCDPTDAPSDLRVIGCTFAGQSDHAVKNPPPAATVLGNTAPKSPADGHRLSGPIGFFGAQPVSRPTGVAPTASAVHAALVQLGLIAG